MLSAAAKLPLGHLRTIVSVWTVRLVVAVDVGSNGCRRAGIDCTPHVSVAASVIPAYLTSRGTIMLRLRIMARPDNRWIVIETVNGGFLSGGDARGAEAHGDGDGRQAIH